MDQRNKAKWLIFIFTLLLLILGAAYFFIMSQNKPVQGNFRLGGARLTVEIADEFGEQYQGLSDRESLCENCGMLFLYSSPRIQNFVMRRMKFPLDFVFVRAGLAVEVVENVPPPGPGETPAYVTSSVPADGVLELNAGFTRANGIKIGDPAAVDLIE